MQPTGHPFARFVRMVFTHPAGDARHWLLHRLALAVFYVAGFCFWSAFFHQGEMKFASMDWAEKYRSLAVVREALLQDSVPYHITTRLSAWHDTTRFLALPHIIVSPQLLLLKYMDAGKFVLWNARIFYTIGFFGCMFLMRRMQLSIFSSFVFLLLFNANGYVTAHLGIGHTEWFGYFLMPFVLHAILDLAQDRPVAIPTLVLGMANAILFLQGAFHFAIWIIMFLALLWMFNPSVRLARAIVLVGVQTALLAAIRVAPTMTSMSGMQLAYIPGYGSLTSLVDAFSAMYEPPLPDAQTIIQRPRLLYPWEYNMYVGEIGLALILIFGVGMRFSKRDTLLELRFKALDFPILFLLLLSVGHLFYILVIATGIPILGTAERAPSRFIIVPVLFLVALGCMRMQRLLEDRRDSLGVRIPVAGLLAAIALAAQLKWHAWRWRIQFIDNRWSDFPNYTVEPVHYAIHPAVVADPSYKYIVHVSLAISLASLAIWLFFLIRTLRAGKSNVAAP